METYEKAYSPKEISLTLDVGDSTLRKWAIALEKNGYEFIRNDQNNRVFVDADIVILRHFKELVQKHNMQLNNAAMLVIDRFGKGPLQPRTGVVPVIEGRDFTRSNDEDIISELRTHIEKQEAFNRELLNRLDQQQNYIEERLNKRDALLMEALREAQETKQLLLAAKEGQQKKPRKGLLRWFSKE